MRLWRWLIVAAGLGAVLMLGTMFWLYQNNYFEVVTKVSSGGEEHAD